jgi:hypothetical protein
MARCATCPVAEAEPCQGERHARLCTLARTRPDYRRMLTREPPPPRPATVQIDAAMMPARGVVVAAAAAVLTAEQEAAQAAYLALAARVEGCDFRVSSCGCMGRPARCTLGGYPAVVTLADCRVCLGSGPPAATSAPPRARGLTRRGSGV